MAIPNFEPGSILKKSDLCDWTQDAIFPFIHNYGYNFCELIDSPDPKLLNDRTSGNHRLTVFVEKKAALVSLIFQFGNSPQIMVPFVPEQIYGLRRVLEGKQPAFATYAIVNRKDRQVISYTAAKIDKKSLAYLMSVLPEFPETNYMDYYNSYFNQINADMLLNDNLNSNKIC